MCGIAGIYHFEAGSGAGLGPLTGMMTAAAHRGPDQDGSFVEQGCLLGHLRLSILDLSPLGRQPMHLGERYVLSFNGEIYNYRELRAELEQIGYRFAGGSDSEVLLAAWAQWGPACQDRLAGMWAFLIYDRQTGILYASRDRFGIKPLYYWVSPAGFVALASEIKQFTGLPGWKARVNPQRLYDYLNWNLTDHGDETLFDGVFQVPAGAWLQLERPLSLTPGSRLALEQWYTLRPEPFSGTRQSAIALFRERFEETIRQHLQADVPVGSCLSGGQDSSSIVCMIHKHLRNLPAPEAQMTFSAVFPGSALDESPFIDAVVAHCRVQGFKTLCDPQRIPEILPKLIWHQDEPTGSASVYVQWQVFALAAGKGIKVMLDGQGADEALGGYHHYLAHLLTGTLLRGDITGYLGLLRQVQRHYGYGAGESLRWSLNLLLPQWLRQPLRGRLGLETLRPEWMQLERFGIQPRDPQRSLGLNAGDTLRLSQLELGHTRLPMLLRWEDRNAMAHSIEARVPFLDHHLVEFLLGLPDEIRLHQGLTKYVLREAMRPLLPEPINQRRDKLGFAPPEAEWIRHLPPDWLQSRIEIAYQRCGGLLTPQVPQIAREIIAGQRPYSGLLWRWLNLGLWMESFGLNV